MTKFLRFLSVLTAAVLLFVSCGDSEKKEAREEFPGDGTKEFVTVGSSSSRGGAGSGDYADEAEGESTAAPGEDAEGDKDVEREIVESDIYKFDGNTLWLANSYKGLISVDISDPKHMKILDTLNFKGSVGEMYLQDGRAYILLSWADEEYEDDVTYYYGKEQSKLVVVNTEDPSDLSLEGEFRIDGTIFDSRQVGDIIYVAASESFYYWMDCSGENGTAGSDQITIMSINVKDPKKIKMADKVSLNGHAYTLYVSQRSIYVAEADTYYWDEENEKYEDGYPITLFDISDPKGKIVKKSEFRTEGFMSDRWKMHESDGVFFAVSSSTSWGNGDSMIESFDVSDPENVKKLDKLVFMQDQQLYGTKFEGDRMYAVTFFQQDPLHVIDISDPSDLVRMGELEVPGWSSHLEIRGTRIIAVGRDGSSSKISMYDVSDPEDPKEINTVTIGSNYSYSEAEYDWKAFKVFDDLGLILFPSQEYDDSWNSLNRLYLVDFDLDKGLKTRGFVESKSYVKRGAAIGSLVFSIGTEDLVVVDAADRDNPKVLSELTLAEYVGSVSKCGKHLCGLNDSSALSIYDSESGTTAWKSAESSDDSYWRVFLLKNSSYAYIFNSGSYYYSPEEGEAKIRVIKFSDGIEQEDLGEFSVPFYGWNTWSTIAAVSEENVIAMMNYYYDAPADYYYEMKAQIAIYDMNSLKKGVSSSAVEFDYENLEHSGIYAAGKTFWTSGCKLKKASAGGDEYLCYALPVDVSDAKNPKLGEKINIPGELVGVSRDGQYLYTQTPTVYSYKDGCDYSDGCWSNVRSYDFYILKLNAEKKAVKVVGKETMKSSYSYSYGEDYSSYSEESVVSDLFIKDDKVIFAEKHSASEDQVCSYKSNSSYDIRIVSAKDGSEKFSRSFEDASGISNVLDGGILVLQKNGAAYVSPEGKVTESDQVFDLGNYYGYGYGEIAYDGYYYSSDSAVSQLLDKTLYIPAGWNGIYSMDVK